jgi:lipid II:glycine glycyltransferase (peptidoglycan interpeptide bridge formation enzyme)
VSVLTPEPTTVREATPEELAGWDALTVDVPGGQLLQSRAWAEHRAQTGWRPWFLVTGDGGAVLALARPWPVVGGAGAYLPRGPVSAGASAQAAAGRLDAVTRWLTARGVDVLASDAEIEVATGYPALLGDIGFRQIEEIQPSRHRMRLVLGAGTDEATALSGCQKSTRQRIRAAEQAGIVVRRWDSRAGQEPGPGFAPAGRQPRAALDRFFDLEISTAARRGFSLGPRTRFLDWWERAFAEGRLVYLEALDPGFANVTADGEAAPPPLAGLVLYRHGRRLSTIQSGDRVEARRTHPGTLHLLRWRAIQLAIREGCDETDLGGVDVAGARHAPVPGDPMYGLYEHKRGFGAEWVELAGAHEKVMRPLRYAAGRLTGRLRRGGAL